MGVYIGVAFSIDQGPCYCFSFNMVLHQTDWCDARPTGGRWDYSRAYSVRIMKRRAFSHSLSTLVLYIADRYKIPHWYEIHTYPIDQLSLSWAISVFSLGLDPTLTPVLIMLNWTLVLIMLNWSDSKSDSKLTVTELPLISVWSKLQGWSKKVPDHIQIKIKMPNPSQEPPAPTKTPNQDIRDMDVLCTYKIKIESQNFEYRWMKDHWPYPYQDQDAKPQ